MDDYVTLYCDNVMNVHYGRREESSMNQYTSWCNLYIRIQRQNPKKNVGPYAEIVDYNTFTKGNTIMYMPPPMPESTFTPSQGLRICSQYIQGVNHLGQRN